MSTTVMAGCSSTFQLCRGTDAPLCIALKGLQKHHAARRTLSLLSCWQHRQSTQSELAPSFMQISTGLDSSTTYSICKWLRDTAHSLQYTMLIALLQPAPETFDLFDDILLLSEGEFCSRCPCSISIDHQIAHACLTAHLGGFACDLQLPCCCGSSSPSVLGGAWRGDHAAV